MQTGQQIEIVKGRDTGETGVVVRICGFTGWVHITLDKYVDDRVYRSIEYGPLTMSEIKQRLGG